MEISTQKELLDIVKKNYDDIAEDFDETRKKILWPELMKLAEAVPAGSYVLDAGCGNGRLLHAFALKKIHYVGIDESKKLIDIARKRWQVPDGKFLLGDILELDCASEIEDEKYDYIFCVAVLHHIPGTSLRIKFIRQLADKLKSDGRMIITVWNLWPNWKYFKIILTYALKKLAGMNAMDYGDIVFNWRNNEGMKRYYHAFRMPSLKRLAGRSDMKIEKLYKDKHNYYLILKK